jgi:hypothetical protein
MLLIRPYFLLAHQDEKIIIRITLQYASNIMQFNVYASELYALSDLE